MLIDPLDEIIKNSYKNFHSRGLDYICLRRSRHLTQKYYFFDGDVTQIPEVVNPHNHRYDFETVVLAGEIKNSIWTETGELGGDPYVRREWRTPLNGGNGFSGSEVCFLKEASAETYQAGSLYHCDADQIHTLSIQSSQAVALINQFVDVVPDDEPTQTYFRDAGSSLSLDGLYERFTRDEILSRIAVIRSLSGLS